MQKYLEPFYDAIVSNDISRYFAIVILAVLALSVLARVPLLARLLGRLERSGATMMTTLGVLGTFVGIFLGLLNFDVSKIDQSVPQLLDGLKIAFGTSIVGMTAAIMFKLWQAVVPPPRDQVEEATPEAILNTLRTIDTSINAANDTQANALEELRRSISSDNDTSLLTQVQKLRTTVQDGQKELIEEFREFAKTMAENNSKALIDALEQVIRDFNTKLNEQFGENFKQLNEAVGALLTWQENYKTHVESLEQRFEMALTAIDAARASLTEIAKDTAKIPEALASMDELLTGFRRSIDDLEQHLEAVAALKDKAVEAFPTIEANLKIVTDDLTQLVRQSIEGANAALEEQRTTFAGLQTGFEELLASSRETHDRFGHGIDETLSAMQDALTKAMSGHQAAIDSSTEELRRHVAESWSKTQDAINEQMSALDQQMQNELNRVMEVMGRNLASLSEKFVSDYTPLTDRLREVVQIAGRA